MSGIDRLYIPWLTSFIHTPISIRFNDYYCSDLWPGFNFNDASLRIDDDPDLDSDSDYDDDPDPDLDYYYDRG